MLEVFLLLFGAGSGSVITAVAIRARHGARMKADASKYESLWSEAVSLLHVNGQISDEQLKALMPPEAKDPYAHLPEGEGFSSDRRKIEVARAEAGLPPADNLRGMFSDDVRKVQVAQIKHGTMPAIE